MCSFITACSRPVIAASKVMVAAITRVFLSGTRQDSYPQKAINVSIKIGLSLNVTDSSLMTTPSPKAPLSLTPPRWMTDLGSGLGSPHRLKAINVPFLPLTTHSEHESAHLFCLFSTLMETLPPVASSVSSFQADTRIHQFWIVSFTISSSSLSISSAVCLTTIYPIWCIFHLRHYIQFLS